MKFQMTGYMHGNEFCNDGSHGRILSINFKNKIIYFCEECETVTNIEDVKPFIDSNDKLFDRLLGRS